MSWPVRRVIALTVLVVSVAAGCVRPFGRQYEYEEEVYVDLDGSATLIVNASLASLAALHGLDVPLDPNDPIDRDAIRDLYTSPVTEVLRVSRPWRRDGRRFVQVRLEVSDVRRLPTAKPFAWASYEFVRADDEIRFVQRLGTPKGNPVGDVGWDGDELVAVRLHIPSKVSFHNAPSRMVERGNIITWEQSLGARLKGEPLEVDVRFGSQRILVLTVALFLAAMAAAAACVGGLLWWVVRKGRERNARALSA